MELTIEKLVYGGDGLARTSPDEHGRGKAVFVPFVLPGERVEASVAEEKPGFMRARLEHLLQPANSRIQPLCPYFQRCGGCNYQHASYEDQLNFKAEILRENLRRIAKLELGVELTLHPSSPWHYRNRTRLKVQASPEFAIGYYKFESHDLLPIEQCPISSPLLNQIIAAVWRVGRTTETPPEIQELEIFVNDADSQALLEIYRSPEARPDAVLSWAQSLQAEVAAIAGCVAFHSPPGKPTPRQLTSMGSEHLSYKTARASYRVSGGAFFQVNRFLTDKLVKLATDGFSGHTALDLYAGVGLFSSVLAQSFSQVIAVEPSPISHADLRYNSPPNVKAVRATTEQYLAKTPAKLRPDLVVVDPPRSGLGAQVARQLASMSPERLVYVSCDPATIARDLKLLLASGYRIEQAHLLDLFPQTYHLESVFHLAR